MRTILVILRKEFTLIFRDKVMLPIIIIVPLVQLIILASAATQELKQIDVVVVDEDMSKSSMTLINKFEGSPFYKIVAKTVSVEQAEDMMLRDKASLVIHIPVNFEKDLMRLGKTNVQLLVNAINGTAANLIQGYTSAIIVDYNKNLISEWVSYTRPAPSKMIVTNYRYWYNPDLNYKFYMVPGILAILITMIGLILTAFNLVKEKEMGTIEQINVTPIKKYQFIIGKLIPFWIIALFELGFGLTIGVVLFNLPIVGSIFLLFGFVAVYLLVALGFGLFLSTMSDTQQQVMFIAFFFIIVFVLMGGIFTPVEGMPQWAQKVNIINPLAYAIKVIRMIVLKGSGFADIAKEFASLVIYGAIILSLAVWRYRKVA
jgi:ABC-2 type transport system permease protein